MMYLLDNELKPHKALHFGLRVSGQKKPQLLAQERQLRTPFPSAWLRPWLHCQSRRPSLWGEAGSDVWETPV